MKITNKATVFMLLIVLLATLFFACAKKAQLTALVLGPTITAVTSSPSSTSATINWTTSAVSTSKVYYGLTTNFGSSTTESDTGSNMTRNHSVNITGLAVNSKYYFKVASMDSANNTSTAGDDGSYSFTTTSAGPTITNVTATSSTGSSATVTWTTNETATSQVFYGLTNSFGTNSTETSAMVTSHSVSLTGLTASTTYYYYVRSKNVTGNSSTSGDDGSKTFYTSGTSSGTAFYLYFDDIKIEGTAGSSIIIYDDNLGNVITEGTQNAAYMGSPNNGVDNIGQIDFMATDEKNSGSASWKIPLTKTTSWWAGIYILSTGKWRAEWSATAPPTPANLSGPTGTVKLTCYAKVVGKTATKIKIGIGDNSGATVDDSIAGGKKESPKLDISNTWTKLELSLGSNPDLTAINGVFFWSIDGADVP